jgi:hypothetical protein
MSQTLRQKFPWLNMSKKTKVSSDSQRKGKNCQFLEEKDCH